MKQFSVLEFGNQKGDQLYFLGGFPDDHMSGWSPLYEVLKQKYSIVSLCLPQFHQPPQQEGGGTYKKWGYTFQELVLMLDDILFHPLKSPLSVAPTATETADAQETVTNTPVPSITFICHDWGAVIGLLYCNKYPEKVKRLILIDVGIKSISESSFWEIFLIVLYQWWFSIAYIIGQFFGAPLGNCIFVTYMIFVTVFPFLRVCPHDSYHRPASEMTIEMCYLYFHYWKSMLQGRSIQPKMPTCPVLYMVRDAALPSSHLSPPSLMWCRSTGLRRMQCFMVRAF
jgi:pimeloyl-ACP methyl ester carboxylesterase